jgi:hypothetical protein
MHSSHARGPKILVIIIGYIDNVEELCELGLNITVLASFESFHHPASTHISISTPHLPLLLLHAPVK